LWPELDGLPVLSIKVASPTASLGQIIEIKSRIFEENTSKKIRI